MADDFKPDPESVYSTVAFEGLIDGTLFVGKAAYEVRCAKTKVQTAVLASAKTMSVTERMTGRVITMEAPNGNPRDILRALADGAVKAEKKLADLEKRVVALEQYMLPKDNGLF